jgi:hypothetical protein
MNNNGIDIAQLMQMAAAQQQTQQSSSSMGYFSWLSLILVALKGAGLLTCSWIWVFFPVTIPWICYSLLMLVGFINKKFFNKQ